MPHVLKGNWAWLRQHATQNPETKGWQCRTTREAIYSVETMRLVHAFWMEEGQGEPQPVLHLYCPGCEPVVALPAPDELVPASHLIPATSFP